jgi:hypothetical protein
MPDAGLNKGVQKMCRVFGISDQAVEPASPCPLGYEGKIMGDRNQHQPTITNKDIGFGV